MQPSLQQYIIITIERTCTARFDFLPIMLLFIYIIIVTVAEEPQSTITSTATTTFVSTDSHQIITNSHPQSLMIDRPLLGSLVGVSIAIIVSLISIIIVVATIFKRKG